MLSGHLEGKFRTQLIVIALTALGLSLPAQAANQRVGVAAAVNPATTGTPPGQADRVIVVGDKMLQNERVVTSDKGRTQLLFLDGSALTIGPNSSVVLDEFVYDPNTKVGKLAFSAAKGLFRLVGGKISKKTPVTFKTPTALIGIRGGIGIITVREADKQAGLGGGMAAGAAEASGNAAGTLRLAQTPPGPRVVTTAQLAFGQMTVRSGGITRATTIPGFQVVAANPNVAPSQPARPEGPSETLSGLEGAGGESTGGAPEAPTNEDVADTQIADLGSNIQPQAIVPVAPVGQAPKQKQPAGEGNKVQQFQKINKNTVNAQRNESLDKTVGTDGGVRLTADTSTAVVTNSTSVIVSGGGRLLRQTPFTNFNFNTLETSRVAGRNITDNGVRFNDNTISIFSGFSGFTLSLPAQIGNFTFSGSETTSSIGALSGSGFGAADKSFFYYNLRELASNNNRASFFAGLPFTGNFPTSGQAVSDLFPGFPNTNQIPMLPQAFGGDFDFFPTPLLYSAYSPNLTTFPDDGRSVAIYGSVAIDGVGINQKSSQVVYIGTYFGDSASNNKIVLSGFARGSVRLSASGKPIRVDGGGGTTSRDGDNNSFFGTSGPDHFVISSDFTSASSSKPIDAAGFAQTLSNTATPAATFFLETYARPGNKPSGLGDSRTSQTLNGFISGMATDKNADGTIETYVIETLSEDPANFQLVTNATTNRLSGLIKTEDDDESHESLVIPLGNPSGNGRSRQAFIDDGVFGVRESTTSSPTIGGLTGTSRIALITSAFTNLSSDLTSGVTFCSCTHTKWGFVSGEVRSNSTADRHRLHLVPWVAGRLSGAAITSGLTGSATYSGHVVANIEAGSKNYVAVGNYSQSWNFSSRSGTATISDLDSATYTGSISGVTGTSGARFSGSISGASRTGNVLGAFMRGPGNSAEEVAIEFHVDGTNYNAVGIGLGKAPD